MFVVLGALMAGFFILFPAAVASEPDRVSPADDGGGAHVIFPPNVYRDQRAATGTATAPSGAASANDLKYHTGPVMRNVVNYVIIWNPPGSTFSPTYQKLIEQYFTDCGNTPFMTINSQYGDSSGALVLPNCQFGGTWVDTANAYPHAGTVADPLVGSDIQNEVDRAIAANPTWQAPGLSTMYFVYLGHNIIECFKGKGNTFGCFAGTDVNGNTPPAASGSPNTVPGAGIYCAYHSFFGSGPRVYANMPYASDGSCYGSPTSFPNGVDQDIVLSPTSHEQFEAYSDPELNAWFNDTTGNENGDNCAYNYGQVEPDGANFVLNGHRYQLQQEWSNMLPGGCIKRAGAASQPTITGDLNFGIVPRGTTVTKEILIQNTAAGDLNLLNVRLALGAPSAFSIDPSSPLWGTLPNADSVTIKVNFSPSASASSGGPVNTSLTLDTDQPGFETQSIPASATVDLPKISIAGDVSFSDTCVGGTSFATLNVCNTGGADLLVQTILSSDSQFSVLAPSSGYPVRISPDFCFPFRVRFAPTSVGNQQSTFTIPSSDPASPTTTVHGLGKGVGPTLSAFIVDSGSFGDVCRGDFKDLNLTINNAGGCSLNVNNITSSSGDFLVPLVLSYPLVIQPGDSTAIPIRFQPATLGPKTGTISISSSDPLSPKLVAVSGNVPPGDIRVTGSTDFGDVCPESLAEKTISICNVGKCNLTITSVSFVGSCPNFALINNPFPAIISHDACVPLTIRFTPTSCGPAACTLRIVSDAPAAPVINLAATANTPCPSIDVPLDLGFAPEVIQSIGPCSTALPFPISNLGNCNLVISSISIGGVNAADYSLSGLPSFPIILQPGHIVGEGNLNIVFAPTAIARTRTATIGVTYISNPISGATTTVTRSLCGEGVYTGARVLVMQGGVPVAQVEKIHLQRITANRNKTLLDSQDVANNLPLVTVAPTPPCGAFQYHREYGTVSNPIQLLPGSYQVTATAVINGKRKSISVGFDVTTCDFNQTIVINF